VNSVPTHEPVLELDDDDRPIGRILSRREVLALMGAGSVAVFAAACAPGATSSEVAGAGPTATTGATSSGAASATATAATAAASALPSCVVVPEVTEGPYYVDEKLERSDIRIDTADGSTVDGATLRIDWVVSQVDGTACIPLEGVLVDVWHCNAQGEYSDVSDQGFSTVGHDYLRGYQHTDSNGKATITTIYPGWYSGRAVHIHFKVRTDPAASSGFEFTSQLFFDDAFSDGVFSQSPYAEKGQRNVLNANDNIYGQTQGLTLLTPTTDGEGYAATFEIAIQTT
jgi:protocatechuate 3,4-dioxygenase beta subunit